MPGTLCTGGHTRLREKRHLSILRTMNAWLCAPLCAPLVSATRELLRSSNLSGDVGDCMDPAAPSEWPDPIEIGSSIERGQVLNGVDGQPQMPATPRENRGLPQDQVSATFAMRCQRTPDSVTVEGGFV